MSSPRLEGLWPEVDRIALCVHRPTGSRPEFRDMVQRLRIPAGSVVVSAARHVAAGRVTLEQLELLARYESRTVVRLNAQRHVELGLLEQAGDGELIPATPFREAARGVLELQGRSATELWGDRAELAELAALAQMIVERAAVSPPAAAPAFAEQLRDHGTTPTTPAGRLLARVTELRYLRSDLHAEALARQGLAGPTARAVDRLWKGHTVSDDDLQRLERKELIAAGPGGWRLTDRARQARRDAQTETERLSATAVAVVAGDQLRAFQDGLARLAGEDPRPPDAR